MSIKQLRDELARLMGWRKHEGRWVPPNIHPETNLLAMPHLHPVELSLDWLAAHELPDGWRWWLIDGGNEDGNWEVTVQGGEDGDTLTGEAPTELHARLAACVAAWNAQHERSGT